MIQTRSEPNGIQNWPTFLDALNASRDDKTIWKISFEISDGTRIRLVREYGNIWVYEDVVTGFRN